MDWVIIVTVLLLLQYMVFTMLVGRARVRSRIDAPATTGDPMLERYSRVQANTLERLVSVIPAMWLFAIYISALAAAGLGLVFLITRVLYLRGYVKEPAKRAMGFGIGFLAEVALLLGALGGAAVAWIG